MRAARAVCALLVAGLSGAASAPAAQTAPAAAPCRSLMFDGAGYTVCTAEAGADLRLFLTGDDGRPLGTFERLEERVGAEGGTIAFAMNAGMYHGDRRPVGLYVEDGQEVARLVTRAGPGNFGMRPNGVFCIGEGRFGVYESRAFAAQRPDCRFATQSGPLLVIGGELHPRFLENSESRYVRNGVGVSADGRTAYFAISEGRVTFHEFARLFRDGLGVPDALYFDGNISRLYVPGLGREDSGFPMGPMVALVVPRD